MKKFIVLLLIGASYLKSYGGTHYAPIVSNDGSPIKKETIISFVFGRKISQPITVYVNREIYINSLENQLSVRKLAYPQYYNADMTLEQWLNKLEWVSGSKFNQQWYKNTGVNKTTGAVEILTSLYPDWGSLPATLKGGNSIGYWCYVSGTFVDPVIKDNCGNIILSNIPVKPLEEEEEQPQKEYATLPCDRTRIEMGSYDTEAGVTYGRYSANGLYYYRNRDGAWFVKNGDDWDSILCPTNETQVIERHKRIVKVIEVIDTVREYRQTNQTVYTFEQPTCNHQFNCNSGCNNQNQNVYYANQRDWGFGFNLSLSPDQRGERIVYRESPQQYRDQQPQQTNWGNSYPMDGGNQAQAQTNWNNSYPFGGGNNQNTNTNINNNGSFDGSGTIYGVNERVGQ